MKHDKLQKSLLMGILLFSLLVNMLTQSTIVLAEDHFGYDSSLKEMNFILHSLDQPAMIGGQETKYIMDTTHSYRFTTPTQARTGSIFKPIGLPKVTLNFFLSPSLTTSVDLDGQWKASIWVNSTAYKPVGFTVELKEVSSTGTVLYDTGQQSPTIISSIGEHLDVQVTNFVLVAPIKHTFQSGSTIQILVDINSGSSNECRFWFDSPLYPSKVILPSTNYARPVSMKTYSSDGSPTESFDIDAPSEKRAVTFSANITDPYGAYDISTVEATILYNSTTVVAGPTNMALVQLGAVKQLYSTVWNYPSSALPGNYSAVIMVKDNNGLYQAQQTNSPEPFIETATHTFQIGPIKYYYPTIKFTDDVGDPLPEAQVFVTFPNGARDEFPRRTDINGTLSLTKVIPADYTLTVLWKNSLVAYTTLKIESDGPYNVTARVYSLKITVEDNTAKPIEGAYVFAYRDKLGYGFDVTGVKGEVGLKVPEGTYDLQTTFSTTYLLSSVIENAEKPDFLVKNSTKATLTLTNYPPPFWATTGFIIIVIGAIMFFIILLIIRRN